MSTSNELTDQLGRLAELHRDGALSASEFEAAKTKLLLAPVSVPADHRPGGFARWVPWVLVVSEAAAVVSALLALGEADPAFTDSAATWVVVGVSWGIWAVIALVDYWVLRRQGYKAAAGGAGLVLGAWAYLLARAIKLRNTSLARVDSWVAVPLLLVLQVLLVSLAPAIATVTAMVSTLNIENPVLEQSIEQWAGNNGYPHSVATCPANETGDVGFTFLCSLKATGLPPGSQVQVTIADRQGEVTWRLVS